MDAGRRVHIFLCRIRLNMFGKVSANRYKAANKNFAGGCPR